MIDHRLVPAHVQRGIRRPGAGAEGPGRQPAHRPRRGLASPVREAPASRAPRRRARRAAGGAAAEEIRMSLGEPQATAPRCSVPVRSPPPPPLAPGTTTIAASWPVPWRDESLPPLARPPRPDVPHAPASNIPRANNRNADSCSVYRIYRGRSANKGFPLSLAIN